MLRDEIMKDLCCMLIRAVIVMLFVAIFSFQHSSAKAQVEGSSEVEFQVFQETRKLSIEEICCGEIRFPERRVRAAAAGLGGNPLWIKLPDLPPGTVLVLSKIVDEATLFELTEEGWATSKTGDTVHPDGVALAVPQMAFALTVDIEPASARYLRVTQPNSISFGLQAWEPEAFFDDLDRHQIVQMLLLGFITAIVVYNFVVSVLTRDIVFALNAVTILSLVTIDLYLSGLGAHYIWPRTYSNIILVIALICTTVFGALFISRFLFTDIYHASARPLLLIAPVAVLTGCAMFFLPYWYPQTVLIGIVLTMLALAATIAILQVFRKNSNAYLLVFPLIGIMLPGGSMVALRSFSEVSFGAVQPHMLEITLAFEALAFSIALAARIRSQKLAVVSARAQLAEAEYESARRYAELQDRERARIASDLHDSIGHNLVMISGLMENSTRSGGKPENLASASKLTRRTIQRVRQLSHALHPSTLSDLGWDAAIDGLFGELDRTYGITVNVTKKGEEPDLGEESKLHLYRILQELVSNIAKHSSASNCWAEFDNNGDTLTIKITDDGVGLPNGERSGGGLGFASIEERLKAIGGHWEIGEGNGKGFKTTLTIPVGRIAGDE